MQTKRDDDIVNMIIHRISLKYGIQSHIIREIVETQFKFTYEHIKDLNFEDKSVEEIKQMKTNFYYKYIGKLYITPESTYKRVNKELNIKKK